MVALLGLLFGILGALFGLLGLIMQAGGFKYIGKAILRIIPGRTAADDAATGEHRASFFLISASIILIVVAIGILIVSIMALASNEKEGPVPPTPEASPTIILETSTPAITATATPRPCGQIRGGTYRNPRERTFFLNNCITPPAQPDGPQPRTPTPPTPPDGQPPPTVTPLPEIFLEGEFGTGNGQVKKRSEASGARTIWLHAGESRTLPFDLIAGARYRLNVRYSNDNANDLPLELVAVAVDGVLLGQFDPQDTGDDGLGWNCFVWSDIVGVVDLSPGSHEVVLSVTRGDGFGVEIDVVALVLVQTPLLDCPV